MLRPRNSATRESVRLDGLWRFALHDPLGPRPWSRPLDTDLEVPVPASYNDLFTDSAIRDHVGWVWYQRTVRVPRGWGGERVALRVDAATHEGRVYVDDVEVARHVGGYLPFEADITELVSAGREFRLTIGVNNELTDTTQPPGRVVDLPSGRTKQLYGHDFFNFAGLHRSVWLLSRPPVHVTDIAVTTTYKGAVSEQDGIPGTQVWAGVDYRVTTSQPAPVRVCVLDEDGYAVGSADGADGHVTVEEPRLWQPGAPYLYELVVEVLGDSAEGTGDPEGEAGADVDGGEAVVIDEYRLPVGIRTVRVSGTRFLINGEPFYFRGFGKHEDTPVRGKGHDPAYLVHDAQLMEWMGANSFRTAHYPYDEEWLDYADRHGIVVIDEAAAVGINLSLAAGITGGPVKPTYGPDAIDEEARESHAQHLRELVARDRNHPSVVMWSIANEPASREEGAREYFEPLVELMRELDPTRPVTYVNVALGSGEEELIDDLFDVLCLNRYDGWYTFTGDLVEAERMLEEDLQAKAEANDKPLVMTEYGADTMPGTHSVWADPWSEEFQVEFLEMFGRVFDRVEAVVGEQVWNFADFRTAAGIIRVDGNRKGVFTRDRRPKAAAFALRRRWRGMEPDGGAEA